MFPRNLFLNSVVSVTVAFSTMSAMARAFDAVRPSSATMLDDEKKKEDVGEPITIDKLPKAVVDSVKKAMPGARITKANKIEKDGKVTYYLNDVKVGKKGWDVTVADDGSIVKKEECHDDD